MVNEIMHNKSKRISWLHISDLHIGQSNIDWIIPGLKTTFYEDLDCLNNIVNGWDLVILSGDLTQSGSTKEFNLLKKILNDIWEYFDKLNSSPKLFIVPGNHDLVRPNSSEPTPIALKSWWENKEIKNSFWNDTSNYYKTFFEKIFCNYTAFYEQLIKDNFPVCEVVKGYIPGDSSITLNLNNINVGLVGLNSSYLHLFEKNKKKLDLDVRQLHAVTKTDPDTWCKKNDINFLVTHHPSDWLHPSAESHFNEEIYPSGRFTQHLYGHMHDLDINKSFRGGSSARLYIQAASLCGVENLSDGIVRKHGYYTAITNIEGKVQTTVYPRINIKLVDGKRKFVPDQALNLTKDNNFILELDNHSVTKNSTKLLNAKFTSLEDDKTDNEANYKSISYNLTPAPQHSQIRIFEQRRLKEAITQKRIAWVVSDWGYGANEFIWSVISQFSSHLPQTYRISLQDYHGRESFLNNFFLQTGKSFQDFCKHVSISKQNTLIIFEDTPVTRDTIKESQNWENEIVEITNVVKEYCPSSILIILSRQNPSTLTETTVIEIKHFEEPDVRTYVIAHPKGGEKYANTDYISEIYRLTGGLTVEIDSLLRQLQFISLSDYSEICLTSVEQKITETQSTHSKLMTIIKELKNSSDKILKRSFNLLKVLTVFPYGETLMRIKRFNPNVPFYPSDVEILSDRGLIDTVPIISTLDTTLQSSQSPRLITPKIIREHIMLLLTSDEIYELYEKAASIYFGSNWIINEPKSLKILDLRVILGHDGDGLGNPHTIIIFLLNNSIKENSDDKYQKIISLVRIFTADLQKAQNYRACVNACQDFLKLIPVNNPVYQKDIDWIKSDLGACLRMLGKRKEACEILENININFFSNSRQQSILLDLALAKQFSDSDKAKELANRIINMDKKTNMALHARNLLIELNVDDPNQLSKLKELEKTSRNKSKIIIANNIAYNIAKKANISIEEKIGLLKKVITSAVKINDNYTATRGIVLLGNIIKGTNFELSEYEISELIRAYHYLYNERMENLFEKCHILLWNIFLSCNDSKNLLILFRHSSFIWRLYGEDHKETKYINILSNYFLKNQNYSPKLESAEFNYYLVRAKKINLN